MQGDGVPGHGVIGGSWEGSCGGIWVTLNNGLYHYHGWLVLP